MPIYAPGGCYTYTYSYGSANVPGVYYSEQAGTKMTKPGNYLAICKQAGDGESKDGTTTEKEVAQVSEEAGDDDLEDPDKDEEAGDDDLEDPDKQEEAGDDSEAGDDDLEDPDKQEEA